MLCNLPEAAKSTIQEKLFGVTPSSSQKRIFHNDEKTQKDSNQIDTNWIKVEQDEDSSSRINEEDVSKNNPSSHINPCRRKHSRKYNSSASCGVGSRLPTYTSSFPKPPMGLF